MKLLRKHFPWLNVHLPQCNCWANMCSYHSETAEQAQSLLRLNVRLSLWNCWASTTFTVTQRGFTAVKLLSKYSISVTQRAIPSWNCWASTACDSTYIFTVVKLPSEHRIFCDSTCIYRGVIAERFLWFKVQLSLWNCRASTGCPVTQRAFIAVKLPSKRNIYCNSTWIYRSETAEQVQHFCDSMCNYRCETAAFAQQCCDSTCVYLCETAEQAQRVAQRTFTVVKLPSEHRISRDSTCIYRSVIAERFLWLNVQLPLRNCRASTGFPAT